MPHACHHSWKCYKSLTFCSLLTSCTIPCACHAKRHTAQFFTLLTLKCASRHNRVQFFISHLASWLRTGRFREPTFRPSGATNHWTNTVFFGFPTFSRTWIFFLLRLSLYWSSIFFSSLLFSDSSHLCFSSVHIVGSLTSKLSSMIRYETIWNIGLRCATLCYVVTCYDTFWYVVIRCDTLWYVLIRCDTLWYVVIRCDTLWYVVIRGDTWWYVVIRGDTLWYVVIRCDTLWCVVMRCDTCWYVVIRGDTLWYVVIRRCDTWWYVVIPCDTLWYVVIRCDTFWYIAIRCDTWWYVVIRCDTLWYVVIRCDTLWYVVIRCDTWWYVVICCDTLWYGVIRGDTWWYVIRCDTWWYVVIRRCDTWWYVVIRGDTWWYVVIRCGTLWYVVIPFDTLRYVVIRGDTLWYVVIRVDTWWYVVIRCCDTLWYAVLRCDTLWYVLIRCDTLWYVVIRGDTWWYVVIRGDTLWYVVIRCDTLWDTLWYVVIRCDTWWYVVIRGDTWWYVVIRFDTFWYVVIRGDTLWYVVIRCDTLIYVSMPAAVGCCFVCMSLSKTTHCDVCDASRTSRMDHLTLFHLWAVKRAPRCWPWKERQIPLGYRSDTIEPIHFCSCQVVVTKIHVLFVNKELSNLDEDHVEAGLATSRSAPWGAMTSLQSGKKCVGRWATWGLSEPSCAFGWNPDWSVHSQVCLLSLEQVDLIYFPFFKLECMFIFHFVETGAKSWAKETFLSTLWNSRFRTHFRSFFSLPGFLTSGCHCKWRCADVWAAQRMQKEV